MTGGRKRGDDKQMQALIPNARATLAILDAAYEAAKIDRCGHGKTWEQECLDCNAVWREEQIRNLVKQAAKYGFRLVPAAGAIIIACVLLSGCAPLDAVGTGAGMGFYPSYPTYQLPQPVFDTHPVQRCTMQQDPIGPTLRMSCY
jgi:hypothetical protein